MLGIAPEHTRQLLQEGPARMKEGREGKVRQPQGSDEEKDPNGRGVKENEGKCDRGRIRVREAGMGKEGLCLCL